MPAPVAIEDSPLRVKDAIRASHLVVGLFAMLFGAASIAMPLAVWKGSTDQKLDSLQKQVDRLQDTIDGLTAAIKENHR